MAIVDKLDEFIEIFSYCYLHGTHLFIKWIPVHPVVADPVKERQHYKERGGEYQFRALDFWSCFFTFYNTLLLFVLYVF